MLRATFLLNLTSLPEISLKPFNMSKGEKLFGLTDIFASLQGSHLKFKI